MKVYTIDFSKCRTYMQFFEEIIKGMEFPDWCGKNFSAIWDMVTWEIDTPAIIYIKGTKFLPNDLIKEKELLMKILNRAHNWYKEIEMCVDIVVE